MSFEPVTRWAIRCDDQTNTGQCPQRLVYTEDPDDPPVVWNLALLDRADLDDDTRTLLRVLGWLVAPDGRVLCPRHVAALEYLAAAALDGLPFPDHHQESR